MMSKDEMRAQARMLRRRLANETPDAGERLASFADDLPGVVVHALYLPMASEVDTLPLARRLAFDGYDLCLPVVETPDAPLVFRRWWPGAPLAPDRLGVPAPLPTAPSVTPELILTPLLAFDAFGGRLGQGGGYYDRTFAAFPGAVRVGVAFSGQGVDRVPMDAHDMPLHGVLTEVGYTAAQEV